VTPFCLWYQTRRQYCVSLRLVSLP